MLKRFALLAVSAVALGLMVQMPAYAQSTEQTDQSEEDWRRSKKKSSSERDDPTRSLPGLGSGIPIPPLEPIDTLPEESRRHLQRQRAKVIAEVEVGETPGDVPFEPSEAAKSDPDLAAEEEEVWELILTDLQGSSGGGAPAESGPNRVAVAGRGGGSNGSLTRGGSSQSAADILAQLKGLQSSGGSSGGSGQDGPRPQSTQAGGGSQSAGQPQGSQGQQSQGSQGQGQQDQGQQGTAQAQGGQQGGADGQSGQAQSGDAQQGDGQAGQQQGQAGDGAQGTGQEGQGQEGQGQQGDAQQGEGQAGDGQDAGSAGEGAQDGASGEAGDQGDAGDAGAAGAASSSSTTQPPPGPLDVVRSQGPLAPGSGAQSSASDFLKGQGAQTPTPPSSPEDN